MPQPHPNTPGAPTSDATHNTDASPLPGPVLMVEDEPLLQQRLRGILLQLGYDEDQLRFAETLAGARARLAAESIGLLLVDMKLPDGEGHELIAEVRAAGGKQHILVVSAWRAAETLLTALGAGANGYVLKERDDLEILLSIRDTLRGGSPIDPFIAGHVLAQLSAGATAAPPLQAEADSTLSPREVGILERVADGLSNREIADHLSLSLFTIETHLRNIHRKLMVSSRAKAVQAARNRGLLK